MKTMKAFTILFIGLVFLNSSAKADSIVIGNTADDRGTVDGWVSNMQVNETDTYTNSSGAAENVTVNTFDFYATEPRNRLTPFVVKVNGDNDFTVMAVGTTRVGGADYITAGAFSYAFDDGGSPTFEISDGDTVAIGYLDANADGSESGAGGGVVSWSNGGDELWYTGGGGAGDSGSVAVGLPPTAGTSTLDLARDYSYNIGFDTAAVPEPSTIILLLSGLAGLFAYRKMRRVA